MEEKNEPKKSSNKIFLIIGIIIILIGAVYAFSLMGKSSEKAPISQNNQQQGANNPNGNVNDPNGEAGEYVDPSVPVVKDGIIYSPEGEPARNDVEPGSSGAPQQSAPISQNEAPANSIKIKMTAEGITPGEFTVKAGSLVTLTVTSGDQWTHVFAFKDPSLSAVAVGLAGGETRSITFNAPSKKGEYEIYCNVPGHESRGEVAKMIVN